MHVCYFSKKCRFCQAFFEELSKTPYTREIRFICVDPSPSRPPLPAWLKSVPTLIVEGEASPRVGPSSVNNWLAERRMAGGGGGGGGVPSYSTPAVSTIPAMSAKLPEPISANTPADSKQGPPDLPGSHMDGPQAWHGEMDGSSWSDGYSFLNDNFTSERGYNPIVRNFESLVATPSMGGMGGGVGGGGMAGNAPVQRSAKEEKLLKDFEAYSKSRDMEFSAPKRMG
jgi:hypothetical protein